MTGPAGGPSDPYGVRPRDYQQPDPGQRIVGTPAGPPIVTPFGRDGDVVEHVVGSAAAVQAYEVEREHRSRPSEDDRPGARLRRMIRDA